MTTIDDEWAQFITNQYDIDDITDIADETNFTLDGATIPDDYIPNPTELYISTKSKITFLTQPVDLAIFWDIPVIPYSQPSNGVIKKQIKIISKSAEELQEVQDKLKSELYCDQTITTHIDNPNGRIKFKDIRKITIGVSKKDVMSYRSKKKQAFYNCFVMILRIKVADCFKEFHVKVFNTGKLEMPGVQNDDMYQLVLNNIIIMLQPYYDVPLSYNETSDTILINSNFNCGYFVNREILYDILRNKYNIHAIYDPCCSYPGIQCKMYYHKHNGLITKTESTTYSKTADENITEISFMIFRTGSVLISGRCQEYMLNECYKHLRDIFIVECKHICQKIIVLGDLAKDKKKKPRKKIMYIQVSE